VQSPVGIEGKAENVEQMVYVDYKQSFYEKMLIVSG
jgi:hypothetical protein